jgi:hypothetical protein
VFEVGLDGGDVRGVDVDERFGGFGLGVDEGGDGGGAAAGGVVRLDGRVGGLVGR